ncbi:MAG: hypothetical protein A3D92_24755 [Bacteroidetes bacterium RIFCSPHIGHO2_02_FULL_44_7]|nr:MAG: hypothetical protein A3D92_24755 [Bacteroidetes bacterium RIFCSPHIGHO2_02_FULL_44_7]
MISYTFALILAVLAALLMILLFVWLWKKLKKKAVAGGTIGFFVGIVAATGIMVIPSHVYVLTGGHDYSHYLLYSATDYTKKDKTTIQLEAPQTQCILVNDTDKVYAVDEVIYGYTGGNGNVKTVEPYSHIILNHSKIDCFFDDEPPASIETKSSGNVSMLWVREYKKEDVLRDQEKLRHLQELLSE